MQLELGPKAQVRCGRRRNPPGPLKSDPVQRDTAESGSSLLIIHDRAFRPHTIAVDFNEEPRTGQSIAVTSVRR